MSNKSETQIHIQSEKYTFKKLCDFFGDREVYFCKVKQDIFTTDPEQMLKCFEILHFVDGLCFWKLVAKPQNFGFEDILEHFPTPRKDHLYVFDTRANSDSQNSEDEEEEETFGIEQWKELPIFWWEENHYKPNIRNLLESV